MALTWMSNRARSAAMPLVSIARPPLVAEYGAMVWRARRDCTEPMFTTLPEPRSAIPRVICWETRSEERRVGEGDREGGGRGEEREDGERRRVARAGVNAE